MKKFKGCLGVFVIFFLGVIVGAILASGAIFAKVGELIEAGPEKVAEFTIQRFSDELSLDSLQKREFQRIADRTRLDLRAIRYETQPQIDSILQTKGDEVRAILNPRQKKKFDELMKRFRERWSSHEIAVTSPPAAAPTPSSTPVEVAAPTPVPRESPNGTPKSVDP